MFTLSKASADHAFLWVGTHFECHSGNTGRVYELKVVRDRKWHRVLSCGCTSHYYRGRCAHADQLEADLNGTRSKVSSKGN